MYVCTHMIEQIGKGTRTVLKNGDFLSLVFATESKAPDPETFIGFIFRDLSLPDEEESECEIYKHYELCTILGTYCAVVHSRWRRRLTSGCRGRVGSGNFSTVKLAINKHTGEKVAIKIIDKRKHWHNYKTRESIEREVAILQQIKHENIISIYDIFDTPKYLYIVLELYVEAFESTCISQPARDAHRQTERERETESSRRLRDAECVMADQSIHARR